MTVVTGVTIPWVFIWLIFWLVVLCVYLAWVAKRNRRGDDITIVDAIAIISVGLVALCGCALFTFTLTHDYNVDVHITDKSIIGYGDVIIFTDGESYVSEDISLYPKIKVGENSTLMIRVNDFGGFERVVGVK